MRMLVFPYGQDCEPIIRHADLLKSDYEIVALVSPGGWGMAGKNVVLQDSGKILPIQENILEITEKFDSLFIPVFETPDEEVESRLVGEMVNLIPHLSHVVCAASLTDVNRKKLEKACRQAKCSFQNFTEYKEPELYGLTMPSEQYPILNPLDVPAIVIAGCWEKTDKFEVSLALRKRFVQNGYRILQIGSRNGCEMFGFHSFPDFMFSKHIDAIDKIVLFNHWIHQMVMEEQPDLLLVTIPGAMQNYNEQFTRGFGILHHQVFQAISPDALVICAFYMLDSTEAMENISAFCRYRYGIPVDVFHMSNLFIDANESQELGCIVTNNIYRETVSEAINKWFSDSHIPIFNGLEEVGCDRIFEILIEKLTPQDIQAVF